RTRRLVAAVDAGHRAGAARGDAVDAEVTRVGHAREPGGASDAVTAAVADLVRAAAGPRRLHRVVVADHRPGAAAVDAGEARVRVVRAGSARGARAAVAT